MTKAALLFLGLAALITIPTAVIAQDNSTAIAVNEAVLRQANTIVLRQKLTAARRADQAGETVAAAKLYQESCELVGQIGSGIDPEASQAINGLAKTRLALAREDQAHGNYRDAATQAQQVLNVDSKNPEALAFKKQNDEMIVAMKGQIPSAAAVEQASQIAGQKVDAGTYVQDGRLLYEMGKLDDAEIKLNQALALNPDNPAAYYYLNLIEQARFARESAQHNVDTQKRMAKVEKQWILPTSKLTSSNPYATNTLIYTGPGRQAIVSKLDHIRLDTVSYDGLPLSEVLRNLTDQSKQRDPERRGVNFLINPNPDLSGKAVEAATGGGGPGGAPAVDPATGLPAANAGPAGGGEAVDVGAYIVKIPNLNDVRLADVLDAIVLVADHPVKYSIQDFAVVFSQKGAETPQLFSRVFKVDPNTFYSGLESVSANSFGSVSSSGSSGGGGGGNGGGGGGGGGGGNNQNNNGAVVGVVNAFAGAGGLRSSGGQGGGGGGGGGQGTEAANPLAGGGGRGGANGGGGGGTTGGGGGLQYITKVTLASTPSEAARSFFTALGVNLEQPPGKSVFFNDRLGKLFVKATEQDLDTIERAIETLNEVSPQVHIKARFIEVQQNDNKALGFDWYLGQFGHSVVAQGGNPGSLNVPANSANPLGAFPGATAANTIADTGQQLFSSGLTPGGGSTTATITGILTNPNFQVVLHALQQRQGFEALAEPEVTTTSGRQTQMRATQVQTIITSYTFQQGSSASSGNNNNNGGGGGN
jgi:tetratricopeptide (TPR) repeat protein